MSLQALALEEGKDLKAVSEAFDTAKADLICALAVRSANRGS